MSTKKVLLSTAIAGAFSIAMLSAESTANAEGKKVKCYGVSKAGENDCANAFGLHSCQGQSKVDNSGGDWKYVASGTCMELGGKLKPFKN